MSHRPPGQGGPPRAPEPVYNHAGAAADLRNPFAQPGIPAPYSAGPGGAYADSNSDVGDYASRRNTFASELDASNPALAGDGQYYEQGGYEYRECCFLPASLVFGCDFSRAPTMSFSSLRGVVVVFRATFEMGRTAGACTAFFWVDDCGRRFSRPRHLALGNPSHPLFL